MGQATMVALLVELATVERLDRIINAVKAARGDAEREPGDLDTYTDVIDWATDIAVNEARAPEWARAERETYHQAATAGPLVLIEVDDITERGLSGALAAAQGVVTYTPTYGTAISWMLNAARFAGHPAPGEE